MCAVPQLSDLDLKGIDTVAVDLETYDPNLKTKGSGAVRKDGFVCGIAIATKNQTLYFPILLAILFLRQRLSSSSTLAWEEC